MVDEVINNINKHLSSFVKIYFSFFFNNFVKKWPDDGN